MINGPKKIYIEKNGKKTLAKISFENEDQLRRLIYKILNPTRRHVDESFPYADVSLKDGSRVNIVIPPLAIDGSTITIRKFLEKIKNIDDLLARNTLDKRMAEFLVACVKAKMNMILSGATGSGKTTTLGALSTYIDNDERIITIEDTPELHLFQEHVVRLETRQPNIEGKGEVTTRDLFKNSLRMRPERIILGEIRGAEALDMLQAICSGHTGSLAVIHGNTPQDVIYRLETMILTSGIPIGLEAIHRQIAAAVHLIIQQIQLLDGSRKITHITQVNGLKDKQVYLEDIFVYEIEEVDADGKVRGKWKATGVVPVFYPLFKKAGIDLPKEIFNKD
jgi:pilus assembly protein CpaF